MQTDIVADKSEEVSITAAAVQYPEEEATEGCWAKFEDWLAGSASDEEEPAVAKVQEELSEAEIEMRLEKALSETSMNSRGQNFLVLNSIIFIAFCISSNPAERIATVSNFLQTRLEGTYFHNDPDKQFADIIHIGDVQEYIRNVVLPVCFATKGGVNDNNYLIALRLSMKRVIFHDNEYDDYNDVIKRVKEYHDLSEDSFNQGEDTDDFSGISYDYDGGYKEAGGYVLAMIDLTLSEATAEWSEYETKFLNLRTATLVIEVLVQNSNLGVTLNYIQIFRQKDSGFVEVATKSIGAFPELYEEWTEFFEVLIALLVLYVLGVCFHLYITLTKISEILRVLWTQFKLEISWNDYVGIASVIAVIVSISLYCTSTLAYVGQFELPMADKDDIEQLMRQLMHFRSFVQVSAVAALLSTLESIAILKDKFPSFGLLFDTVRRAYVDISNFTIILVALLLAFGLMGTICFGAQAEQFSTLQNSMLTLFTALLNNSFYEIVQKANDSMAAVFFILFIILFNFVLMNMFLAIVMSTFHELSNENSHLLQAKASLTADQVKKARDNWRNLLCCRVNMRSQRVDAYDYHVLKEKIKQAEDDNPDPEDIANLEYLRQAVMKSRQPSLWETITYNIGVISNDLYSHKVMRKEAIRELMDRIRKLENERRAAKQKKQALTKDMEFRFKQVREMLVFVLYIVIFTVFVTYRTRVPAAFDVSKSLTDAIVIPEYEVAGIKYDFYDNDRLERISEWTDSVLVPMLSADYINYENNLVRNAYMRITIQVQDVTKNKNSSTKKIEVLVADDSKSNRNFYSATGSSFDYVEAGDAESYMDQGGFVKLLDPNTEEFTTVTQSWLNLSSASRTPVLVALEYVTYNSNYDLYCYVLLTFSQDLAGRITPDLTITSVQLDLYGEGKWLSLFEISFVLFTLYYTWVEGRAWWSIWKTFDNVRKEEWRKKAVVKQVLLELGLVTKPSNGVEAMVLTTGSFIGKGVLVVITFITQGLQVTYKHCTSSIFVMANIACTVLSYGGLYYELLIISSNLVRNFEQPEDSAYINKFTVIVEYQAKMQGLLAFTLLFSYLRVLQFFSFSKKLSMLTDSLSAAFLDVAFFMVMFVSILFSYSIMGYLLLGHYYDEFGTLARSFVSCYTCLLGEFDLDKVTAVDKSLGLLYFISFAIIFNFLLINMFIAIIVGHYRNVRSEYTDQKRGFFAEVFFILRSRCRKRKQDKKRKRLESVDKDLTTTEREFTSLLKVEEEGWDYEEIKADPLSPNYYMMVLERTLKLQSSDAVIFSKLKPTFLNFYELGSVVVPADQAELTVMNDVIWNRLGVSAKLSLWRRMGINWEEQKLKSSLRLSVSNQREQADARPLSPIQESLWSATSDEERLEMWAGEVSFNDLERVRVWNSVSFSEKNKPDTSSAHSIQVWAEALISPLRKTILKLSKMPRNKRIEFILNWKDVKDNERLRMLISLDKDDQMLLYINQGVEAEADLLSNLLMSLIGDNPILVGNSDLALQQILDNQIHSKYSELANYQAETNILASTKTRYEIAEDEDTKNQSYINHLVSQIQETRIKIKEIKLTHGIK
jgi:hypothetical protein